MKAKKLFFPILLLAGIVFLSQCAKDRLNDDEFDSILPENFAVDIPSSISKTATYKKSGAAEGDTLSGDEFYEHLTNFIAIGEASAELVEEIIWAIRVYNINKAMEISYEGDDDGRTKNLVVVEKSDFEGTTWDFELTVTDADSESNADGGIAMQIFWNANPIKGIAILKPYNIDRISDADAGDAIYKIEYDESSTAEAMGYDATMIVTIVDIPLADPSVDQFAIDNLKMFAGKKGDIVDVYGNSNHPNAFYDFSAVDQGLNWAFVASGDENSDYGVAEVGLPGSTEDLASRTEILVDNSMKTVWSELMTAAIVAEGEGQGVTLQPSQIEAYIQPFLQNADAPGYFDANGFIQGGTSPGTDWDNLASRLDNLSPYNPKDISELTVTTKN